VILITLLTLLPLAGAGQDSHLKQDPAQKLFSSSSFAHGYLHGYQLGFHNGDMDLQLSHSRQNVKSIRDFRQAAHHYKKDFGDRGMFCKGYEYGFRVGYADAVGGSEFRAIANLRELAHQLPDVDSKAAPILNEALTHGYLDGVTSGLNDGRAASNYRPDGSDCELALRFKDPPANFYCGVYSLGYRLGYSDGFHNQRPAPEEIRIAGDQ
jgi:hypothetical protein